MQQESGTSRPVFRFGRVEVRPQRREILVDGAPVRVGDRAFEVLLVLLEAKNRLVTKEELMQRVWPDVVVEDINLSVQISTLRKVLGPDRDMLKTISGRGFRFVADVEQVGNEESVAGAEAASRRQNVPRTNLPEPTSDLIGRESEIEEVLALCAQRRLVTLTGSGGIGKTRLGIEVARQMQHAFRDGVWLVELATITAPGMVSHAVADALGLTLASGALSAERVASAVGDRQILLVLDNCEHLIDAAAVMAEALLRLGAAVSIVATSREPLRADGEAVYNVPPLGVPADDSHSDNVLRHGAVRLFIARAHAAESQFRSSSGIAAMAAICRHLDGIPLAIELAAARAAALGVEGLAARLHDRFRLLTGGLRTALPRHQTLQATLDWSYELLPAIERVILRRLAVFSGAFTLESVGSVVSTPEIPEPDVVDYVGNLVTKSLIVADVGGAIAQYRLLETTRAYALGKLVQSGELAQFSGRHAQYYRELFERATIERETRTTDEWMGVYARNIDNVRAALDWAFSPAGDAQVGVALAAASVPLWMERSLMEECRWRVQSAIDSMSPDARQGRLSMELHAALGLALMYTQGAAAETRSALAAALEIAESAGDVDYQLRALLGLCTDRLNNGVFREALMFAQKFSGVAVSSVDPVDVAVGNRMTALSLFFLGYPVGARRHFESMLAGYVAPVRRSHMIRFQFDQRVTASMALAEVLWVLGFPDQAIGLVNDGIEKAVELRHSLTICNAMAKAFPVAIDAGNLDLAEKIVRLLLDHSARNALASWQAEGRCYEAVLTIKRGDFSEGPGLLRKALDQLPDIHFSLRYTTLLGELADAFCRSGEAERGLAAITTALERAERNEERWCMAELLRIKGELLWRAEMSGALAQAADQFRQGMELARTQSALSWELRCASSLARLLISEGDTGEARAILDPVLARFTEGFGTADLVEARRLLDTAS